MPHVLVADGDGPSLQHIVSLLEHARYQVSRANDGKSAMKVVTNQTPDLVLMEVLLPDQEGFEICRRIRRTSDVPIVFLSTKARAEDRVLGFIASKGDRDLLRVETSRGSEQTISTTKYEVTGRGGKGRELLQRGQFTRVIRGTPDAPPPFE